MKKILFSVTVVLVLFFSNNCNGSQLASDVMLDIYDKCLSQLSMGCVKPKALAWLSKAVDSDEIKITNDLSIIKTSEDEPIDFSKQRSGDPRVKIFDKIDSFLASHSIRIGTPEILKTNEARALMGDNENALDNNLVMPLTDRNAVEGTFYIK